MRWSLCSQRLRRAFSGGAPTEASGLRLSAIDEHRSIRDGGNGTHPCPAKRQRAHAAQADTKTTLPDTYGNHSLPPVPGLKLPVSAAKPEDGQLPGWWGQGLRMKLVRELAWPQLRRDNAQHGHTVHAVRPGGSGESTGGPGSARKDPARVVILLTPPGLHRGASAAY